MRLEFHSLIASDISCIMEYYEVVAGPQLADEFYNELTAGQNMCAARVTRV